jgi:hypothetical protein
VVTGASAQFFHAQHIELGVTTALTRVCNHSIFVASAIGVDLVIATGRVCSIVGISLLDGVVCDRNVLPLRLHARIERIDKFHDLKSDICYLQH